MVGKRDYRRWSYEEETETSVEEQLSLEEHESRDDASGTLRSTSTFVQPTITLSSSRIHQKRSGKSPVNSKMQLMGITAGVLVAGFIAGFVIGVRQEKTDGSRVSHGHSLKSSSSSPGTTGVGTGVSGGGGSWPPKKITESSFHKLITQINADNIRHNLQRMSQEVHASGTPEARSMAMAIRDLWRSYGLSVRVEQHKSFLTKTGATNGLSIYGANGSVIFTTSLIGDAVNLPNARAVMAFSQAADFNGTLIYGHYGRPQDFQFLLNSQISVNGSIALLRFPNTHLSKVVGTAIRFGVAGLVFYPDPGDFGPLLPSLAIRRSSLLNLGQIHEFQKHRNKLTLPCHTISFNDAEKLLRLMENEVEESPSPAAKKNRSQGKAASRPPPYSLPANLHLLNEVKATSIFNVVAAIPGAWESDRYVVAGCSHDSWTFGAGDPGLGLALMSEIARAFSASVQGGWKPRRSVLLISWDANLHASAGVWHWLQEHHFEISTRAIAYIDLSRVIQGNQSLHVFSSPLLKEVGRKAVQRVMQIESGLGGGKGKVPSSSLPSGPITFSSLLTSSESSFAFFGNLGIPFFRLSLSNGPKAYDYPLFQTAFDTFDNFKNLLDPTFTKSQTIGRIISGMIVLLADSSLLPVNVEDYVEEIQKAFGSFMAHYQEDLHRANLSIAYWQAAVMRLEVIGENFRTDIHNRSVINNEQAEPATSSNSHPTKTKKLLFHRIINDKMMELDRAFLSRKSDVYKHQIIGFSSCSWLPTRGVGGNGNCPDFASTSSSMTTTTSGSRLLAPPDLHFTKLKEILERGRKRGSDEMRTRINCGEQQQQLGEGRVAAECEWRAEAGQEIASLIRCLDAAAAILQSPLLPEESGSSS